MKLSLAVLVTMISVSGFAGAKSESIYNALKTPELIVMHYGANGAPVVGVQIREKSVGGLSCQKSAAVVPHPVYTYNCSLSIESENVNKKSLYEALDTKEMPVRNGKLKIVDFMACAQVKNDTAPFETTYACQIGDDELK